MHFRGMARVEGLEARKLLTVVFVEAEDALRIVGTDGDDQITVSPSANLMNVIRVVVRNDRGREEKYASTGRFRYIDVLGGAGNDEVIISSSLSGLIGDVFVRLDLGAGADTIRECSLGGTIRLGDGNDRLDLPSGEAQQIFGDAGDDTITVRDGAYVVDGGAGNDNISVGEKFAKVFGGDGNDVIVAPAKQGAQVEAGDGDDRVTIVPGIGKATGYYDAVPVTTVYGGDGLDTLTGSDSVDELHGGDDADVLITKGGADTLYGDAGNDVLDASEAYKAVLYGGKGDDDLYGREYGASSAYGGEGRDWFDTDRGAWTSKDYDPQTDVKWGGKPNTPSYGGSYGSISTGICGWGGPYDDFHLARLGDVGFVVAYGLNTSATRYLGYPNFETGQGLRPTPVLTPAERKGLRNGVVRLPAGWKLANERQKQDGFVYFDVRFGKSGNLAKSTEFGRVYQLCVKVDSVVVTSDGDYTSKAGRVAWARSDALVMALTSGATARVAGTTASYLLSGDAPTTAVKTPSGYLRGIYMQEGILWLPNGEKRSLFKAFSA